MIAPVERMGISASLAGRELQALLRISAARKPGSSCGVMQGWQPAAALGARTLNSGHTGSMIAQFPASRAARKMLSRVWMQA